MINEKVKEIMKIMSNIQYGFKDKEGNNLFLNQERWNKDFSFFYYLQTPEELLETKCGICWDQVELERKLFFNSQIINKTYFIFTHIDGILPSHTFLIYCNDNKYYWFEHSWSQYIGIHEYDSDLKLLQDVANKFRKKYCKLKQNTVLYLYEYQAPKKHIKCNEFYKYIESQNKIEIDL